MPKGDSNTCRSKDDTSWTDAEDYWKEEHSNRNKDVYSAELVDMTEDCYKKPSKQKKSKSANDNIQKNAKGIESMVYSSQNKNVDFSEAGLWGSKRTLEEVEEMAKQKRKSKSKHKQSTDTWKSDVNFGASSSRCPSNCMTETQGTEREVNLGTELWDKKNQSTTIWK